VRGADVGEAAGLDFDHGAEVVAAPGALLLQVEADVGKCVFGDGLVQQAPVGGGAIGRRGPEGEPGRVRGEA
jgi:hypothetical protein